MHHRKSLISRRDVLIWPLAAALAPAVRAKVSAQPESVVEDTVVVDMSDGACDAAYVHPRTGAYPGVIVWADSLGLRPAMRTLAGRVAAAGYSVLVPNPFYRTATAPVFDATFDYAHRAADRERYARMAAPLLASGAVERDAVAYVAFLDRQPHVDTTKKLGVHGYCLGGPFVLRTAAVRPDRVGAGASFHGGFLVTERPDSPHRLAPRIGARLYFAIAADDDRREPEVKTALKDAFGAGPMGAEVEVYPEALHGFTVPDAKEAYRPADAERAHGKLLALYKSALR
jgi:carboxymethylenebutenolidase